MKGTIKVSGYSRKGRRVKGYNRRSHRYSGKQPRPVPDMETALKIIGTPKMKGIGR